MTTIVLGVALAFVVVGGLFVVVGVGMGRGQSRFKANAARAAGTVTDLRSRSTGDHDTGGVIWVPVVKFTTADGRTVEAETSGGSNVKRYKPGQPIEVLYDPANPADARVPDWGTNIIQGVFIAMGGVFVVIGLAIVAIGVAASG